VTQKPDAAIPKVSFIVPCYNLGHFLAECVNSILSQSYRDFEVLIMDDCSPDDTPRVAQAFQDPRVRYVRNEVNLGHVANYNKAIELSRGTFIWVISADDRLRRPYVLERYVELMEVHREVGYVFCPAMGLTDGEETEIVRDAWCGATPAILSSREFLPWLLKRNRVHAPTGMARRECYEQAGGFPLDLPYACDWYIWCHFSMFRAVAFLPEPMVNYRVHPLCMTHQLKHRHGSEDIAVRWRVMAAAEAAGVAWAARLAASEIATDYAFRVAGWPNGSATSGMTWEEFETSARVNAADERDVAGMRRAVYAALGDIYYGRHDIRRARRFYRSAMAVSPLTPSIWVKYVLLAVGGVGVRLRRAVTRIA
jgi:glycosyltransferase involved in cell wall biosynthesis